MTTTVDKLEELRDGASFVVKALQEASPDAQDAIWIIAMISAFFLNTHRTDGTSLDKARTTLFDLITKLSDAGEDTPSAVRTRGEIH